MEASAAKAIALLVLAGGLTLACADEPAAPLGSISSEAAQQLVLQRDDAREALARRERELQAEIDRLRESGAAPCGPSVSMEEDSEPSAPVATVPRPTMVIAVDMLQVNAKPIKSSGNYTYFSWQTTLRNNLEDPMKVKAVISFRDADGFELEDAVEYVTLQPSEQRDLTGVEMISAESAGRVSKVTGRVEQ